MRPRVKTIWLICAVAAAVTASGQPARAGGGAWLEFDDHPRTSDYLAIGTVATGRMWALFEDDLSASTGYFAYLEPASAASAWDPTPGISGRAEALGPIELGRTDAGGGQAVWREVLLRFTVPDVPPGRYVIEYCNRPCTRWLGSTDVNWPTTVTIVASPLEARVGVRLERLENRMEATRARNGSLLDRVRPLVRAVQAPGGLADDMKAVNARTATLVERVEAMRSSARQARSEARAATQRLYALVVVLMLGSAGALSLVRRSRPERVGPEARIAPRSAHSGTATGA